MARDSSDEISKGPPNGAGATGAVKPAAGASPTLLDSINRYDETPGASAKDAPTFVAAGKAVEFNVEYVAGLLVKRGLLTDTQALDIIVGAGQARNRILRDKRSKLRNQRYFRYHVSPVEVIASFQLPRPGREDLFLDEDIITAAVAEEAGFAFKKLDILKLKAATVTGSYTAAFARRHMAVPIEESKDNITIAIANPHDTAFFEEIRRVLGKTPRIVITPKADILRIIDQFYGFQRSVEKAGLRIRVAPDITNLEQYIKLKSAEEIEYSDRHIVNAVDLLLQYAFDQRASDIHIEPKREVSQVRMRIDGVLHNIQNLPRKVHAAVVSRIKIMARLDVAEKRRPQDGRIKTAVGDKEIELRISVVPTVFGEKIVIRIFDPEVLIQDLDALGFDGRERERYEQIVFQPHGMVLVTGPTGSGKTTTLYSSLQLLAGPDTNICTIEDPVEMVFDEFNQTAVNAKIGVTFAAALRALLRQDPDVIMVGEIRDPETAENAVQAALTGHLVLSTLHTNDTASAVTRLSELDVKPYLIASTLIGIMAQRLVRRVCPYCKQQTILTPDQVEALDLKIPEGRSAELPVWFGEGCVRCRGTGYLGRIAIFELMPVDEKIRKLVNHSSDAREIHKAARQDGMVTLRENAIKKLALGVTTFEEVVRVTTDYV